MAKVSDLIAHKRRVQWRCCVCYAAGPLHLMMVWEVCGDISLANRRPPCKLCPGRVKFVDVTSIWGKPLDTIRETDEAFWEYGERERAKLQALGWRVEMGKWVAP